jgi:UDP-GlcNAc:undecaprenyl-phosphate/decaprenyl-phosphate GlcNAc-1-phosphate transferase
LPLNAFYPFIVALLASAALTPLVMLMARRVGFIDRPRADRWSQREVAKLGGIAIVLATLLALLLFAPKTTEMYGLILGGALVFGLGLYDDIRPLRPAYKFLGQLLIACLQIAFGVKASVGGELALYSEPLQFLSIPLTVLWVVGISNAFNLLDNMDGLSAGVAMIAAAFLTALGVLQDDTVTIIVGLAVSGSCLGFLFYNFNPAKVFMGDCGSLFLGFLLASATLVGSWKDASHLSLVLLIPVLLLGVPIFDTTLVTILRKLHGRPASQGGKDHTSHRLVALGFSERKAVLFIYGVCILLGVSALAGFVLDRFVTATLSAFLVVSLLMLGIFLGDVKVYRELPLGPGDGKERPFFMNTLLLHKRRIVEIACDFALACIAYVSAYLLRFDGVISGENARLIEESLAWVALSKLFAFGVGGVYSGAWKYTSLEDGLKITRAVLFGEVLGIVVLLGLTRFTGYSRALFVVDALLFTLSALGIRFFWRFLRERVFAFPSQGKRVAVIARGGASVSILDAIYRDRSLGLKPVAVVDDDPQLIGRSLRGVPVVQESGQELKAAVQRYQIEELLIAPASLDSILFFKRLAEEVGLPLRAVPSLRSSLSSVSPALLSQLEAALYQDPPDVEAAKALLLELKRYAVLGLQELRPPANPAEPSLDKPNNPTH